ncbi:MAG: acyltransferase family protein [Rubripirellula sp.]|nr:acyltransferase family protein [Rubripirellula sp.]
MSSTTTHRRYHDLDALRAIAMLLGILLHGMMSFIPLPVGIQPIQDVHQHGLVYGVLMDLIHGFRMPLFFLVSGFFTTMMWQKRGPLGLVQHRLLRVGVPLFLGLFTIVPAIWVVLIFGGANIWSAVEQGDTAYVESYVGAGGDLNRPRLDDGYNAGAMPLHLAVAKSDVQMVDLLVDSGADIEVATWQAVGRQLKGSTPLHWAAGAGDEKLVIDLLARGANVNSVDIDNRTPMDLARQYVYPDVVQRLSAAGGTSGDDVSVDRSKPATGVQRSEQGVERDYLREWVEQASGVTQVAALFVFFPVFMHLWFLYYLLWLVAGFVVIASLTRLLKLRGPPAWMLQRPVVWCWIIPLTFMAQLMMVQTFGPDTATGILPWPPSLLYYAIFFGFGALCYGRPELESQWGGHWVRCLILALLILPIGVIAIEWRNTMFWPYHAIAALVAACYVWLMSFGLIGLFQHFFASQNDRIRYLSDSAYWLYLMHLPLVQLLQSWMADWPLPSSLKLLAICSITTVSLLICYEVFVRYTPIGTLLNGKKVRAKRQSASPNSSDL